MSKFFTLSEFTFSILGNKNRIVNELDFELRNTAAWTLAGADRVRHYLNHPMQITSGYRCRQLNRLVGGADDSQHVKAEAIDFICPKFGTPKEVCIALAPKMEVLGIDQLIYEASWIHMSFSAFPRHEALRMVDGKYLPGIG